MPRLHQVVVQVLELAGIHIFDYDDSVIGGVQGPFEIGRHGGMVRAHWYLRLEIERGISQRSSVTGRVQY